MFVLSGVNSDAPSSALIAPLCLAPGWYFAGRQASSNQPSAATSAAGSGATTQKRTYGRTKTVQVEDDPWSQNVSGPTTAPWDSVPPRDNGRTIRFDGPPESGSSDQMTRPYIEGSLLILLRLPEELEAIDKSVRFTLPSRANQILGRMG
jgi:hypothetical protein